MKDWHASILAFIASHGPCGTLDVATGLGQPIRTVRSKMSELRANGALIRTFIGGGGALRYRSKLYAWSIPSPVVALPRMSAGEYRFAAPSGSRPCDVEGTEP